MGLFIVYPINQNLNKFCIYFRRNKVIQKEALFVIILEVPMISVIIYLEKSNAAHNTFRSWLAGSLLIEGGGVVIRGQLTTAHVVITDRPIICKH